MSLVSSTPKRMSSRLSTSDAFITPHIFRYVESRRGNMQMCVQRVKNPRDFAAAMPLNENAALVVFNFVQRNCRACRYASRAFERMAAEFAGRPVRFCEMDVSERQNQRLCRDLGVDMVPMFQFYKFKDEEVGVLDQVVGPREVERVREKVSEYSSEGFDLEEYVFEDAKR